MAKTKAEVYDIECLPNTFTVTFAPVQIPADQIEEFKRLDIAGEDVVGYFKDQIKGKVFVIHDSTDMVYELLALKEHVDSLDVIIGYNNHNYDDPLLYHVLSRISVYTAMCRNNKKKDALLDIYNSSNNIIETDKFITTQEKASHNTYPNKCMSLDIQRILHLDVGFVSLKQCQIVIKWHNVKEFELPPITDKDAHYYNAYIADGESYETVSLADHPELWAEFKMSIFDRYIPDEYLNELVYYNINDVMSTLALFRYENDEVVQRLNASNKYDTNVRSLSRPAAAEKLLTTFYMRETGDRYWDIKKRVAEAPVVPLRQIIDTRIEFSKPTLKHLLRDYKAFNVHVGQPGFKAEFVMDGNKYSLGLGGVHTIDRPGILKSTEKYVYRDADAASYYPTTIINNKLSPRQMDASSFLPLYIKLRDTRIKAKSMIYGADGVINEDAKSESDILKIVLNSTFGKFNEPKSLLYDPFVAYGVTVNCQLYMLKLVEMLILSGIEVVSANTDGVVCKLKYSDEDKYYKICENWQRMFNQVLEYTDYSKYVRNDINNYLAITTNGKVKTKGRFGYKPDLTKGYIHPVVPKAILSHFVDGVSIQDFITNHKDIYDFCISIKVGRQFNVEYHTIQGGEVNKEIIGRTNRYYISNKGGTLMKSYKDKKKEVSLVSGEYIRILNKFYEVDDMSEYDIKYNFYRKQAMKVVESVYGNSFTVDRRGRTRTSGSMFDELET